MQVQDIMISNPACCSPTDPISNVAQLMIDRDCGEIPVCDNAGKPIGVITDRDIACRAVASSKDPDATIAQDIMSNPVFTAKPTDDLDKCCQEMEQHMIRRIPVIDDQGRCCGIVSLSDIAQQADARKAEEVLQQVSQPTDSPRAE